MAQILGVRNLMDASPCQRDGRQWGAKLPRRSIQFGTGCF